MGATRSRSNPLPRYPPQLADLPTIDYDTYRALNNPYEYGSLEVTESGSVIPRRALRPAFMKFLGELGLNKACWNGRNGFRGMIYKEFADAHVSSAPCPLAEGDIARLQMVYTQLMPPEGGIDSGSVSSNAPAPGTAAHSCVSVNSGVGKERRGRTTVLDKLMIGMDRDGACTKRRPPSAQPDVPSGVHSQECSEQFVRDELSTPSKRLAAIGEGFEGDESAMKRLAVLEHVFGGGGGRPAFLVTSAVEDQLEYEDVEQQLVGCRQTAFLRYVQILRVYADAKAGVGHLHVLEGTLKSILENLREAMRALSSHAVIAEDGGYMVPLSPSYRLAYVKTLRETADKLLPDVIRYCPYTGIGRVDADRGKRGRRRRRRRRGGRRSSRRHRRRDGEDVASDTHTTSTTMGAASNAPPAPPRRRRKRMRRTRTLLLSSSSLSSSSSPPSMKTTTTCCKYSTFSRTLSVLPEFSKLGLRHAFRIRQKVNALYEHAAAAYEEVNVVYDFQLALTKRTLGDLRHAGAKLVRLENELWRVRERMLLALLPNAGSKT